MVRCVDDRNWLLVLLISSDSLTGKFGFSSNAQVEQSSNGAFSTDVMKRTSIYFTFILYSTAVLALIRYLSLYNRAHCRFTGCMVYLSKLGLLFCCRRR